jgi:hypothetical protein
MKRLRFVMEKIIETKTKRWQPMEMDLELNSN